MSLAQMERNAEATLEARAAEQAELEAREATRNSAEVQALNDAAQLEIYGAGGMTNVGPSGGILKDLENNPRFGKTEADRAASVAEYTKELDGLLQDDFELTQAKFLLDLKLEDNDQRAMFIAKQIASGKSVEVAKERAFKVYDAKDEKRRALVKQNQLFNRGDYEDFLHSSKEEKEAKASAAAAEAAAADEAVNTARADINDALDDDLDIERPAHEVEAEEAPAEVEADADDEPTPADEPAETDDEPEPEADPAAEADEEIDPAEADAPAAEADADKAPFVDALNDALVEGENKLQDISRLVKKAKELVEAGNSVDDVVASFNQASESQIDAIIAKRVEAWEEAHGSEPDEATIADLRKQMTDAFESQIRSTEVPEPEADPAEPTADEAEEDPEAGPTDDETEAADSGEEGMTPEEHAEQAAIAAEAARQAAEEARVNVILGQRGRSYGRVNDDPLRIGSVVDVPRSDGLQGKIIGIKEHPSVDSKKYAVIEYTSPEVKNPDGTVVKPEEVLTKEILIEQVTRPTENPLSIKNRPKPLDEFTDPDKKGVKTKPSVTPVAPKVSREDLILQKPGNGELVPRAGILPDFGRTRRARSKLNRRAADLDAGTGKSMYVTNDGRISDIPASTPFDSLTKRQAKAIKINPKTGKPVTKVDIKTNKSSALVSPAAPSRLYDTVRNRFGKQFDPSDATAVAALPSELQDALKTLRARVNNAQTNTDRAKQQIAYDSLVESIADDFGKRRFRR